MSSEPSIQEINIQIPFEYKSREYQRGLWHAMRHASRDITNPLYANAIRRAVVVWHRRAGKEKTCFNILVSHALQKVGTYYYLFPTFSQGRKILWDGMDKSGFRFIEHIPKEIVKGVPNSAEMKIRLLNGSIIQVIGTDNIDSIVGTNPIGCVFSEYSLQDPKAWQLIRPILAENKGWAIFNGTPRGKNHLYDLFTMAQGNDAWFSQLLTVKDTQIISEADIQAERDAGMSEDFIQQEFYCSFTLGVEGSYYANYIQEAKDEGRIANIRWDKGQLVHVAFDIGYGDSCAITFYQLIGNEIHVIDYYENNGEGFPHYAALLKSKPYLYGSYFGPHDIDSHQYSTGLSTREVAQSLGINFITLPTLKLRIEDGIEAVRSLLPRCWFNMETTQGLVKCLENYRKEFDERMEVYKSKPRHDKYSHGADSFRYTCIAIKMYADHGKSGVSDEQSEEWYNKYYPRFDNG